jgi:hypothetical protein
MPVVASTAPAATTAAAPPAAPAASVPIIGSAASSDLDFEPDFDPDEGEGGLAPPTDGYYLYNFSPDPSSYAASDMTQSTPTNDAILQPPLAPRQDAVVAVGDSTLDQAQGQAQDQTQDQAQTQAQAQAQNAAPDPAEGSAQG